MSNFDLSDLALKAAFPNNRIIVDNIGMPSVMVYIPKFKISDVIAGGSNSVHPAFIVNGVEKAGIYISKYQNKVVNERAYSLPAEDPAVIINFDTASSICSAKGSGWHLMTNTEWAALSLWCKKQGFLPRGNNSYGKDNRETGYIAVPTYIDNGQTGRVATGTGPVEWSHNHQLNGIYDLNGNVYEWCAGLRLVYGELQIIENNNAAAPNNLKAQWKAVNGSDGTLITPNDSGTTLGALRLDYLNSKWKWITGAQTGRADESRVCYFSQVQADANLSTAAREILYTLALLPDDAAFDYEGDYFYANNGSAERSLFRGGEWYGGGSNGVFCTNLSYNRSAAGSVIGFRAAFIE
ncbi:MAG: SUMF1/EgtB/PvdO family nonheme iron enzyme [Clostridia bacterium]